VNILHNNLINDGDSKYIYIIPFYLFSVNEFFEIYKLN